MIRPAEPVDPLVIREELERLGAWQGQPLSALALTASTNDDARAAAAAGAPHGSLFVADAQTAGRGRGGHTWHSPPGENLYLSVILRPRVPAAHVTPFTLAAGVAVARVLEDALDGRARVWVKWPNDVLAAPADADPRKKLAGLLVEGQLRGAAVSSLVAGVGVNVLATSFPPDLADRATSLALLGGEMLVRSLLAARIAAALVDASARFEVDRLASFAPDLAKLDGLRGTRVEVSGARGVAEGIDAEGRLAVRGDDGKLTAVVAGEVVVDEGAGTGRCGA